MLALRIEGSTRTLGREQGYLQLPIRDIVLEGNGPVMASCWEPNPEELKLLNAGAKVRLYVAGTVHPPVMVEVA